jgi:hypothetical protein
MNAHLVAGVAAGIAGLFVFLVLHHLWIAPIWFILPFGAVAAAIGGAAVGWAYGELSPYLPSRPWTTLAVIGLIAVILLPSIILAELREPLFDISVPGGQLQVSTSRAVVIFVLELLLTATLAGGIAGWLIGRSGQAALATAVAGFIFALGPGHNIPLVGSTPGVPKEIIIMAAVVVVSALVMVEVQAWLAATGPMWPD